MRIWASLIVWALVVSLGLAAASAATASRPPNIVYIVSDDQGWKDVGYHGSDIRTPNIDALARGGVRLEQFYAEPMCTPTRAALMTGRYPFRYGLQTARHPVLPRLWPVDRRAHAGRRSERGRLHDCDRRQVAPRARRPEILAERQRGFDFAYGPLIGEIDYFTHTQHGVLDWRRNGKPLVETGYSTTLLGDDAVGLIRAHDPKTPLFLYLAFNAPHTPYQAPQSDLDRYKAIADPSRRTYAAAITAMDDEIGRVVAALDKRGMRDNTLIVFQSDNGGTRNPMFAGEGDMSKIKIPNDNGPYPRRQGLALRGRDAGRRARQLAGPYRGRERRPTR